MIEPYHVFLAATFILWLLSTPRDRSALRVVLIASVVSEVLVDAVTSHIDGAWKLVIPAALEILTILALLRWARTRTGYLQAALLCIAWAAHLMCYWDIFMQTDIVYSRYEAILYAVSAGQLATCYDTMLFNLGRAYSSGVAFVSFCSARVSCPSLRACVSWLPGDKSL